jgi:AcrR family transcriptional regulator
MAKTARRAEEITVIKDSILMAALDIIVNEGFANLSMRKLASRLNMTAANIYNYYSSKDEIYLLIQARGFEKLFLIINNALNNGKEPYAKLESIVRLYIDFGIKNPDYYEIMFNRNTPRYADYIGTEMEIAAEEERNMAMMVVEKALVVIREAAPYLEESELMYHVIKIWIMLNGIVSLSNSRGLVQVEPEVDLVIERIIEETINSYRQ